MSEYETIDEIAGATVTTIIPYAESPEIRQHDTATMEELLELIQTLDKGNIAERVIHVDIEHL